MIKVVVLLPRREGMSEQEFERYQRERHLPLVTKLPGLRRLVVGRVLPNPNGPPPAYDAVAEDWFDDLAAMGAAFASPEGQAVIADAPNFLDMARFQLLVVEEEEIPLPTGTAATSAA
ncbi:MAG: EthD family reductase [Thermomicrobiales bacterium]